MSERSGVNLRGEYGPPWEGPPDPQEGKSVILAEATKEEERKTGVKDQGGDVKMGEGDDAEPTPEERKTCAFSPPGSLSNLSSYSSHERSVLQDVLVYAIPVFKTSRPVRIRHVQSLSTRRKYRSSRPV